MSPITPYTADLAGRDPLDAIRDSLQRVESLTHGWTAHDYERRYAPGKWTARQLIIHLTQSELALGTRARMALSTRDYAAQSFDQDAWMAKETAVTGAEAAAVLVSLMRMNLALFGSLSPLDRDTPLTHPEYGALSVDWIIHQMAGHHIHHLTQLQML
jgi:hypothetical protein